MREREKLIVKASWISISGNAFLAVMKIIIGLLAGSLAVVGDGIDSGSDIIISVITLITAHVVSRPPNIHYSYGYEKADTVASKVLSFIIFFAGAQLAISTFTRLIEGSQREMPEMIAIYATLVSIGGKILLARYQKLIGKKTGSSMLIANARNMLNDVIISLMVLVGLVFTFILKMPIFDTVTAFAVSIWIMYAAYRIFMKSNLELMDGIEDASIYNRIFLAVSNVPGVYNPHKARVRKIGYQYAIAVDIEVAGTITVDQAHDLAEKVEDEIKKEVENVYDVMIHIEPVGSTREGEKFGVSHEDLHGIH
jgi:cation diffusion facilitator family transporter